MPYMRVYFGPMFKVIKEGQETCFCVVVIGLFYWFWQLFSCGL